MNGVNAIPAAWIEHDKNIKPYLWSHRVLSIGKTALTLGLLIWFVVSLRAFHLEDFLERKLEHPFLRWLAYFGIVMAVLEVCTLPMSVPIIGWSALISFLSKLIAVGFGTKRKDGC